MNKLLKIKEIKPKNSQLLIRTDVATGEWFIHFYTKKRSIETGNFILEMSIFKDYYSDSQLDGILDEIIEWCVSKINKIN